MAGKKDKQQSKQFIDQNPVEAFRGIGKGVAQSLAKDVVEGSITDLWRQFLSPAEYKQSEKSSLSGDLEEGQELSLKNISNKKTKEKPINADAQPGINYRQEILHGERKVSRENSQMLEVKIQQIIVELKKLTTSSKELQVQFKQATVEILPVNPGKYHVSFFEWLLATIKIARMKIEDSASWLSMFRSKKAQKQYWSMFKKHGTTFGLSNERVVATQTG